MEAVLKISELQSQIAHTLDHKDLYSCLLVCRQWSHDFWPLLWRELTLTQRRSHTMKKDYFQKNAYLIRTLNILDPMPLLNNWLLPPVCCNLVELCITPTLSQKRQLLSILSQRSQASRSIDQDTDFMSLATIDKAMQLIKCNPNLQEIQVGLFVLSATHTAMFMEQLCNQESNITRLSTHHWNLSSFNQLDSLLKRHPRLRTLNIFHVVFNFAETDLHNNGFNEDSEKTTTKPIMNTESPPTMTLDFGKLRSLSMAGTKLRDSLESARRQVQVIAPELTLLNFVGLNSSNCAASRPSNLNPLALRISSWHCPNLKRLKLKYDNSNAVHSANMILTSANSLESLEISSCMIQSSTIHTLLQKHANTLQSIKLTESDGLESMDLQLILTSCPNLLHFAGPDDPLLGSDLIKEPWVCHQLQSLTIVLSIPSLDSTTLGRGLGQLPCSLTHRKRLTDSILSNDNQKINTSELYELYGAIYDQLAPLHQLRSICFGRYFHGEKTLAGIPWSLKMGLDRLRGLSKMEKIYVSEYSVEIGKEEMKWFKAHWPRLKVIEESNLPM